MPIILSHSLVWAPTTLDLGSVWVSDSTIDPDPGMFSFAITCKDPQSLLISYNVVITPTEPNPSSVIISGNTISGRYKNVFEDTLQYLDTKGELKTSSSSGVWDTLEYSGVSEATMFRPSSVVSKTYSYTVVATATTPINISLGQVATQTKTYTITVNNNWDSGATKLKQLVQYTKVH